MKEGETLLTEKFLKDNYFKKPGVIASDIPYTYEDSKIRVTICLSMKQYIYLENKENGIVMEFRYRNVNKLSIEDFKKCLDFTGIEDIFDCQLPPPKGRGLSKG